MLPSCLSNIGESKHTHLILESIKNGVSMHVAKVHIGTLASTRHANGKTIAKHLRLDRCYIYQNLQHRGLIDDIAMDLWCGTKTHEHCTTFSP
jgi:hypothetical protein